MATLLREIDRAATAPMYFHCIGGFAVSVFYGAPRSTVDLDILVTVLDQNAAAALTPARQGGELHRRLGVYVHEVAVATPPCEYESRLREYCAGVFERIHLWIPDPYDLALLKLERNTSRDREDVRWLARQTGFDANELRRRYQEEQREYLIGRPASHDLTLRLWIEMIEEDRAASMGE